jgi:PhnB protein
MSKVKAIPEGMHSVTPHLVVGNAAEAIDFYQKAFGAEEIARAPDPSGQKIWHAMLRIGNSMIFVNDAFPEMGSSVNRLKLWIYSEDVDAMFIRAVAAGAQAEMPPADMFWGDRICKVTDRWGTEWFLAQHVKDMTPEEMKQAQDEFVAQSKMEKPAP